MMIRWTVSSMAIALLLGTAASAASLAGLPNDVAAGVSSAPTSPSGDFDLGLVRSMLDGHGKLWAQQEQACQKVTQPCGRLLGGRPGGALVWQLHPGSVAIFGTSLVIRSG